MQDKYVGDIGDFGKYALLNYLRLRSGLGLSVVWYWVNPEHTDKAHQKNDGKYIHYLGLNGHTPDTQLQRLEPGIFCLLQHIVANPLTRNIKAIENSHPLGNTTVFHSASLSDAVLSRERSKWFQSALKRIRPEDILFLDPDNGLASETKDGESITDAKHVLRSELRDFWMNGHPIIVLYHHLNRSCPHETQIGILQKEIESSLKNSVVLPLRYRRGSSRAFFVVVNKSLSVSCKGWLRNFTAPWPKYSFEYSFSDRII